MACKLGRISQLMFKQPSVVIFRGEIFMFSLSELAHGARMCVSKRKTDKHKGKIKRNQQRKANNK
jgi:hypothetical protein